MTRRGLVRAVMSTAVALLVVQLAPAEDGPVKVSARASATEVTVGQAFTVSVQVAGPPGAAYTFPESSGDDRVELRLAPPPPEAPPPANERSYQAAVFALDEVAVPAVLVSFRLPDGTTGAAASQPIALKVVSLLPKGDEGSRPADIRPPVPIPTGAPFWIALGTALVAMAALVALVMRWRRRPRAAAVVEAPPVPPDVEARAALERLAASGLAAQERFKEFYVALVEIPKRYLERRLEAPVLEMTSHETVLFLRGHPQGCEVEATVRDLTGTADLVKFAKGSAAVEAAQRHLAAVSAMVEVMESRLSAPAATGHAVTPPAGPGAAGPDPAGVGRQGP